MRKQFTALLVRGQRIMLALQCIWDFIFLKGLFAYATVHRIQFHRVTFHRFPTHRMTLHRVPVSQNALVTDTQFNENPVHRPTYSQTAHFAESGQKWENAARSSAGRVSFSVTNNNIHARGDNAHAPGHT